jgi:CRP/FNR family transcriptional regulator, cyclic AMP receptor protein
LRLRNGPRLRRVVTVNAASFLARIKGGKTRRQYRPGQRVYSQGDAANAVFYLVRGKVEVTVLSARGKQAVISVLGRGTFFGESSLALQPRRRSTARVLAVSSIVRVAKREMIALLHGEPKFAALFTAHLLSRNVRIEQDLIDQLFNSSEKRLARVLLLLAHFGKEEKPKTVAPGMTQAALASLIGISRAKVSFFLKRFRRLGFIDGDGVGLQVHRGLLDVLLYD